MKSFLDSKAARLLFGGDPRENAARYEANQQLKEIADSTHPWTVEALRTEVERWLREVV